MVVHGRKDWEEGIKDMTQLQAEISKRSKTIAHIGELMIRGVVDVRPEVENVWQRALTDMMVMNEEGRKIQEETFKQIPWMRKIAERR